MYFEVGTFKKWLRFCGQFVGRRNSHLWSFFYQIPRVLNLFSQHSGVLFFVQGLHPHFISFSLRVHKKAEASVEKPEIPFHSSTVRARTRVGTLVLKPIKKGGRRLCSTLFSLCSGIFAIRSFLIFMFLIASPHNSKKVKSHCIAWNNFVLTRVRPVEINRVIPRQMLGGQMQAANY